MRAVNPVFYFGLVFYLIEGIKVNFCIIMTGKPYGLCKYYHYLYFGLCSPYFWGYSPRNREPKRKIFSSRMPNSKSISTKKFDSYLNCALCEPQIVDVGLGIPLFLSYFQCPPMRQCINYKGFLKKNRNFQDTHRGPLPLRESICSRSCTYFLKGM